MTGEDIIFTIGQADSKDGSGSGSEEGVQVISAKSIVTDIADVSRVTVSFLSALILFIYNVAIISSLIQRGDTPDTAYPVLSHMHSTPPLLHALLQSAIDSNRRTFAFPFSRFPF